LEFGTSIGDEVLDSHQILDIGGNSGDFSVEGIEFGGHLEVSRDGGFSDEFLFLLNDGLVFLVVGIPDVLGNNLED
jgi:hypothetical protein